ncbi:hypothetical protein DIPPA_15576 [Diplonema papillatum]|nr:hypothetical protein DIPPA_15576 [Diplonema papillatum]
MTDGGHVDSPLLSFNGEGTLPNLRSARFAINVLQLVLALLTAVYVTHVTTPESLWHASMMDTISTVFIGELPGVDGFDNKNEADLYSSAEVQRQMRHLVGVYYAVSEAFPISRIDPDAVPVLQVTKLTRQSFRELNFEDLDAFDLSVEELYYPLTQDCPLGPFDPSNCTDNPIPNAWSWVRKLAVNVTVTNLHLRGFWAGHQPATYDWTLKLTYHFEDRTGIIRLLWEIERDKYADRVPTWCTETVLNLCFALVLVSILGLELYDDREAAALTWREACEKLLDNRSRMVELLSVGLNSASLVVRMNASYIEGSSSWNTEVARRFLLGLASFFAWLALTKPLSQLPHMGGAIAATKTGLPAAMRFGVPVVICFVGFACCGCVLFGGFIAHFNNLDLSFELLYSLMVGDAIFDTFNSTHDCLRGHKLRQVLARIYCYSAIGFMYYIVLNQFFAVMEDAYVTASKASHAQKQKDGDAVSMSSHTLSHIGGSSSTSSVSFLEADDRNLKPMGDMTQALRPPAYAGFDGTKSFSDRQFRRHISTGLKSRTSDRESTLRQRVPAYPFAE